MRHLLWISSAVCCLGGMAQGQVQTDKPQTFPNKEVQVTKSSRQIALADDDRPTAPRNKRERGAEDDDAMSARGVVKSFHENPKGDVDGLTLEDGTEVRFPPHLGKKITEMLAKGDEAQVVGRKHTGPKGDAHVRADTIKNVKSGDMLDVKKSPPHKPGDEEAITVHGVVKSFHENPKGDADGLTLADGMEVRFPPHVGKKITDIVAKGDEVEVNGHKHTGPKGDTHVRFDAIKNMKSGKSVEVGPPHDHAGPVHEQMLIEIRAIRALIEKDTDGDEPVVAKKHDGPPHEQVLHELRELRKLLEHKTVSQK